MHRAITELVSEAYFPMLIFGFAMSFFSILSMRLGVHPLQLGILLTFGRVDPASLSRFKTI